jgi:hypothetical protein
MVLLPESPRNPSLALWEQSQLVVSLDCERRRPEPSERTCDFLVRDSFQQFAERPQIRRLTDGLLCYLLPARDGVERGLSRALEPPKENNALEPLAGCMVWGCWELKWKFLLASCPLNLSRNSGDVILSDRRERRIYILDLNTEILRGVYPEQKTDSSLRSE